MTVSPYLQLKTRTEAQARQDRIDRIARKKFANMPTVCRQALAGDSTDLSYLFRSFLFEWRYGQ